MFHSQVNKKQERFDSDSSLIQTQTSSDFRKSNRFYISYSHYKCRKPELMDGHSTKPSA